MEITVPPGSITGTMYSDGVPSSRLTSNGSPAEALFQAGSADGSDGLASVNALSLSTSRDASAPASEAETLGARGSGRPSTRGRGRERRRGEGDKYDYRG